MERRERGVAFPWWPALAALLAAVAVGCQIPSAHTSSRNYALRPEIPVDPPSDHVPGRCEDCITGGQYFKMYCGSCHNARPLSERPFSNYEVAVAHMRDQAYLTGREYRQIIHFLRRWHDLGPPTPNVRPSPKRLMFSQPIPELRPDDQAQAGAAASAAAPPPPPPAGRAPLAQPAAGAAGAPRSGPPAPLE